MPAPVTMNEDDVRHLLRRTGFGVSRKDWKKAQSLVGESPAAGADYVLNLKRKTIRLKGEENEDLHNSWVRHLIKGKTPFQDKVVLFWHDHFATSASVVDEVAAMKLHVRTHYDFALGNFKEYCKAINTDPAMMIFLDTQLNNKDIPNENYGRELCELFTLGVCDLNGVENYTQEDIVQIARAFTGWRVDFDEAYFEPEEHDYNSEFLAQRGPKNIFVNAHGFGPSGAAFDAQGEGEPEIDEVIEIIFSHLDSDGENTVARRTAYRLLEYFAYANPDKDVVDDVVSNSAFVGSWEIEELIRAILVHDAFWETRAQQPFSASTRKSVKHPIDYVVSTMRTTNMKAKGSDLEFPGGEYLRLIDHLSNMGQIIGEPPSVFGWDWEKGWISSSTLLARYQFARDIANARESGRFRPEKLIDRGLSDPGQIVDAVLAALGLNGQFSPAERQIFIDYATDDGAVTELDLGDPDVRNIKLNGLFSMAMQTTAYQLH